MSLRTLLGGLPRAFWWLWAGSLVNRLTGFVVPFLAVYLTRVRGFSPAAAGALVAGYGAGWGAAMLVGGTLADRIGRRRTMLLGLSGSAAAALGLAAAHAPAAVAAWVVVYGFFAESYFPAVQAAAGDLVPERDRPRAFGLLYWAVNLGFAVGMVVAGALAEASYAALFVGDAVTTLAFAGIVAARFPETRRGAAAAGGFGEALRGLRRTFSDRRLVLLLGLVLANAVVFIQIQVGFPLDAAAHGVAPATFGRLVALNCAVIGVAQPFASRFLPRLDRGRVLAASALCVGTGFGLYAFGHTTAWYALGVLVWTAGEILGNPTAAAVVADLAPEDLAGRYQGALGLTWSLAALVGPLAGGALVASAGSRGLWLACLGAGATIAALHLAVTGPMLRRTFAGTRPASGEAGG